MAMFSAVPLRAAWRAKRSRSSWALSIFSPASCRPPGRAEVAAKPSFSGRLPSASKVDDLVSLSLGGPAELSCGDALSFCRFLALSRSSSKEACIAASVSSCGLLFDVSAFSAARDAAIALHGQLSRWCILPRHSPPLLATPRHSSTPRREIRQRINTHSSIILRSSSGVPSRRCGACDSAVDMAMIC